MGINFKCKQLFLCFTIQWSMLSSLTFCPISKFLIKLKITFRIYYIKKKCVQQPLMSQQLAINIWWSPFSEWRKNSTSQYRRNHMPTQGAADRSAPGGFNIISILFAKQQDIILMLFLFMYKAILTFSGLLQQCINVLDTYQKPNPVTSCYAAAVRWASCTSEGHEAVCNFGS